MAPAPCDARWALETFAAVSGVLPVRPLRTKAMQMDAIVAGSALPVRESALADNALPCDCVRQQVQLKRARYLLGSFSICWRKRAGCPVGRVICDRGRPNPEIRWDRTRDLNRGRAVVNF